MLSEFKEKRQGHIIEVNVWAHNIDKMHCARLQDVQQQHAGYQKWRQIYGNIDEYRQWEKDWATKQRTVCSNLTSEFSRLH